MEMESTDVLGEIREALQMLAIPEKVSFLEKFFKTAKGGYGEGDLFLGIPVPDQRSVANTFYGKISLDVLGELISSPYHEHRLTALLILVMKFEKARDNIQQHKIVEFYLRHLPFINNWDLVDTGCYKILGRYAFENQQGELLRKCAVSEVMWHKRMAVVGTLYYLKKNNYELTKELVTQNMAHPHDLMHKANGWMLKEMGKRDKEELICYLNRHYREMPRTCLRYAIEKLEEPLRQNYLKNRI